MKTNKYIYVILLAFIMVTAMFTVVACDNGGSNGLTLKFDDGENLTMNIGETKMLPFTASTELKSSQKATITSSDTSVVSTTSKGYVSAVGKGSAVLTLAVEGTKATAKINIEVVVPTISDENKYYINVNTSIHTNLFVELGNDVSTDSAVYVETYRDGQFLSRATADILPNRRAYVSLDDMQVQNGVYKIGVAVVGNSDAQIKNVYLTDAVTSYSFVNGEDWVYSGAQMKDNSVMKIANMQLGFGGARITLDIQKNTDGTIVNPYIRIRAVAGSLWSVKLRRGDGIDARYEEVIQWDISLAEKSVCLIDLNKYSDYIRGGQTTVVIYAIQGDLTIGDIINYSVSNTYDIAISESKYKPLESVTMDTLDQLFVGQEYDIDFNYNPTNASFKNMQLIPSNDNVTVVDSNTIAINKPGECVLSYVGFDGTVYGTLTVNGRIKITSIDFTTNAGCAVVNKSAGTFNLEDAVSVSPSNASKVLKYELVSTTSQGATVSEGGVITFSNSGVIKVKLTAVDNINAKAEFALTVVDSMISTESATISGGVESIAIGETLNLTATVAPSNATHGNIIWRSSNTDVATVSNGTITSVKAGTVTIFAFAEDGQSYDTIALTVRAIKQIECDPSEYNYGSIELSNDIIAGDKVTVNVYCGEQKVTLVERIIAQEELDVNGAGSMDAQRRIIFALDNAIFNSSATYTFEVVAERNGEPLQGYTFGSLILGKTTNATQGSWYAGYNCTPSGNGDTVATLSGDGYGNIAINLSKTDLANVNYLLVNVSDRTANFVAIKIKIGDSEITLTTGDCSSLGVYKFDLSGYTDQISVADTIELKFYVIGEKDSNATITDVLFVTSETKA